MDHAFACADIVVSRAGAGTISELCAIGKATIFVPSPNVAEDHQTHNAMALVQKDAAIMIADSHADTELVPAIEKLISSPEEITSLEKNIFRLARPDASAEIAGIVLKTIEMKRK